VSFLSRVVVAAMLFAASAGCSSRLGGGAAGRYDGSPGEFPVEEGGEVVLRDLRRAKDLRVTVSFPAGDGPFPVILFSHGAGANGNYPYPLTRFWTSHGYVCIHPTHADSLSFGGGASLAGPIGWENRARDLTFVLDSIEELEGKIPALGRKIDAAHIGVAGYSYGAHSAQVLAGASLEMPGGSEARSLGDPRPLAFLLLSSPGAGDRGLTEKSWNQLTRPMMAVTGSRDVPGRNAAQSWHFDPFRLSPAGEKYALFLEGASHGSFTGRLAEVSAAREEQEIFRWVRAVTLAFWDAYLNGDRQARDFLDPTEIAAESKGRAKLSRR
jgi:predicted dienelactone hydrolase